MDVLGEILAHCLPTYDRDSIMNLSEAPVPITHVCSAWRSIELSAPRLWSRFHMYLFNPKGWRLKHQIEEYSEEVQR